MKILIVNKFYYRRGGDCAYSMDLENLLKAHGHEVAFYSMQYPLNEKSEWDKYFRSEVSVSPKRIIPFLRMFFSPYGDKNTKKTFSKILDDFKPDVVHLNNIHTSISPIVAELAHIRGIRVVWTLHDYKLICPSYGLYLNGKTCELCVGGCKKNAIKNKCLKNNLLASWIGYKEAICWNRQRLEDCTDLFICPSNFMREKMMADSFDEKKLIHLCNFINFPKLSKAPVRKKQYCVVGRLTKIKGIETLLEAASKLPYDLFVIGTGDLEASLKEKYKDCSQIHFMGHQSKDVCLSYLQESAFSVIASECFDNNPLSVIESLCCGTPVIGARIGGIPELIKDGINGKLFSSGNADELKEAIDFMMKNPIAIDANEEQEKFSAEQYYSKLIDLYTGNK